jgi:hypothetical protein
MFPSLWSRRGRGQRPAARGHRRNQRLRLYLEQLEDRCLLSTYTPGSLVEVSSPDPLASCPPGPKGAIGAGEPDVAVNPANPNNIAAIWIDHGFADNVAGVTLDGGTTWQNVPLPLTQCAGGTQATAFDPWVSFAPNGDLYSSNGTFPLKGYAQILVTKSTSGGLSWTSPIQVDTSSGDTPSITADPTDPNYVYATWPRFNPSPSGNGAETMFARSVDGGQTWQPERDIHDASGSDFNWGNRIVVLPDGTLIDAFCEGEFKNNHQGVLTLLRSSDHGQTWSAPITAAVQQPLVDPNAPNDIPVNALVTDPDTGQGVNAHPMFDSIAVDRTSGKLYAVWLDARFSNFQYNGIALSMSSDGGLTWSQPIQVNQTPNTVPATDRQAWNPTVAVAADGTVAVTYYDFRNNTPAPGCATDYWLAYCHPSATASATKPANWREVRLTDTSFNLEQAPVPGNNSILGGSFWLGEYEGLAAAGNDFVAVWGMPNGSSTDQASIFFRRATAVRPQIGSFTASPHPESAGASLTLTAANVVDLDPGSTVTQVAFYQDSNGDGVLESGTDTFLGYGVQTSPGVWTLTFSTAGLTGGTYTLFAQAEDSYGVFSTPLPLTLVVP